MSRAIGMVEYGTVSTGIMAADLILKTAEVEVMMAKTVCPGKYIVLFTGDIGAVKACLEASCTQYKGRLIDYFLLGNPHSGIFNAVNRKAKVSMQGALGVLETKSAAAIFVAADEAAKTAEIELVQIRVASGMCGKSYVFLTGELAAVEVAIERAKKIVEQHGKYLDSTVVANPDTKLWNTIL